MLRLVAIIVAISEDIDTGILNAMERTIAEEDVNAMYASAIEQIRAQCTAMKEEIRLSIEEHRAKIAEEVYVATAELSPVSRGQHFAVSVDNSRGPTTQVMGGYSGTSVAIIQYEQSIGTTSQLYHPKRYSALVDVLNQLRGSLRHIREYFRLFYRSSLAGIIKKVIIPGLIGFALGMLTTGEIIVATVLGIVFISFWCIEETK